MQRALKNARASRIKIPSCDPSLGEEVFGGVSYGEHHLSPNEIAFI